MEAEMIEEIEKTEKRFHLKPHNLKPQTRLKG